MAEPPVAALTNSLQCGHGGEAVENLRYCPCDDTRPLCFNAATAVKPWRTGGPAAAQRRRRMLQCGHGGEAVENRSRRKWSGGRVLRGGPRARDAMPSSVLRIVGRSMSECLPGTGFTARERGVGCGIVANTGCQRACGTVGAGGGFQHPRSRVRRYEWPDGTGHDPDRSSRGRSARPRGHRSRAVGSTLRHRPRGSGSVSREPRPTSTGRPKSASAGPSPGG